MAVILFTILVLTSGVFAHAQDRYGAADFVTTDTYEIKNHQIKRGYVEVNPGQSGDYAYRSKLPEPLEAGSKFRITGYKVMNQKPGSPVKHVYYSVGRIEDGSSDKLTPVTKSIGFDEDKRTTTVWIKAEDLISAVGDDLLNCDVLPMEALALDQAEGVGIRPRQRKYNTIEQNLLDIAEIRDGILDELNVQVPALTSSGFGSGCENFVSGENELGPWGEYIVSEIIGVNRGETYHVDVDPKYFFEVPKGYFGDACPNFNYMTTGQKLGLWVTAISALSMKESSCKEDATNPRGTNNKAIGLLQNDAPWKTRTVTRKRKDGSTYKETILGRKNRGEGCNARTEEPSGYMLHDYKDALSCGIQNLGDISCGAYSRNFGKRPVCRPDSRPRSFFGRSKISNQEFGPLKGGNADDRRKQAWIKAQMRRVPGCVDR